MPTAFIDDPAAPGRRIWRRSSAGTWGPGLAAAFLASVAAALLGFGLWAFLTDGSWSTGDLILAALTLLATGTFLLACALVLWRDARGKRAASIALEGDTLVLDLRADRSLIHRPAACQARIPLADIAAIETRIEAYNAIGMANLVRTWRLVRRTGESVFLFEQRALGTSLEDAPMDAVAAEIAGRAGTSVVDRGMVLGHGGLLVMWFVRAPAWDAAPLAEAMVAREWRRGLIAAALLAASGSIVLLVQLSRMIFK